MYTYIDQSKGRLVFVYFRCCYFEFSKVHLKIRENYGEGLLEVSIFDYYLVTILESIKKLDDLESFFRNIIHTCMPGIFASCTCQFRNYLHICRRNVDFSLLIA